jgi:glycosyltransferase involved in cell wall biosynthesis
VRSFIIRLLFGELLANAVMCYLGEGWCLPVAEAMSMEMPVIVSNFSGPTAYANDSNAYLIPVSLTSDGYADPDVVVLTQLFREVYANRSDATIKGKSARKTMQSISPESVVSSITSRLLSLAGMRGWNI